MHLLPDGGGAGAQEHPGAVINLDVPEGGGTGALEHHGAFVNLDVPDAGGAGAEEHHSAVINLDIPAAGGQEPHDTVLNPTQPMTMVDKAAFVKENYMLSRERITVFQSPIEHKISSRKLNYEFSDLA